MENRLLPSPGSQIVGAAVKENLLTQKMTALLSFIQNLVTVCSLRLSRVFKGLENCEQKQYPNR